jgi:Fic family protein
LYETQKSGYHYFRGKFEIQTSKTPPSVKKPFCSCKWLFLYFIGGMNARKYQSITQVSKATATRHLQDLVEKGILIPNGDGRGRNYQVNLV